MDTPVTRHQELVYPLFDLNGDVNKCDGFTGLPVPGRTACREFRPRAERGAFCEDRQSVQTLSRINVTGPSFTRATSIMARKTPVWTGTDLSLSFRVKYSYNWLA